jgi:hypothetical protein
MIEKKKPLHYLSQSLWSTNQKNYFVNWPRFKNYDEGWICTGPKSKLDWTLFKGWTSSKVLCKCHWRSPGHAETLLNLMISCNCLCQTINTIITTISKNKFWKTLLELGWGWFWVILRNFLWTNRVMRKHSTRILSLVIDKVRHKTNQQKNTLVCKEGVKLRNPSILVENWVSSCLSFFLSASTTAVTYIFSAPTCVQYYNYSRTLCN